MGETTFVAIVARTVQKEPRLVQLQNQEVSEETQSMWNLALLLTSEY